MEPMSCMKASCLEFLAAPLFQRAKESLQQLANPPNMLVKGPVGSFNYAWYTNRKTEIQMVKTKLSKGFFPESPRISDPGHCLLGLHNLHWTFFSKMLQMTDDHQSVFQL